VAPLDDEESNMEVAPKKLAEPGSALDRATRETPPAGPENQSVADRAARGKRARSETPRSSHGVWDPPQDRRDPIQILEQEANTRVPELVPIRHGRMLTSPFAFFRGSAAGMASDLAGTPDSGLRAQLCGDAHLSNFGAFAAPDRRLVFDVNDFDESLPGPWEWDVKRLGASFAIAARERGLSRKQRRSVLLTTVGGYRRAMREFARLRNLDVWYARLDAESVLKELDKVASPKQVKRVKRNVEKAQTKDSLKALARLTHRVDGELRIVSDPPLVVPVEELTEEGLDRGAIEGEVLELMRVYRQTLKLDRRQLLDGYRYVHMARKVVGVGSVGTRCWIMLLVGRDEGDPLFLQCKEAGASVLEPYAGSSRHKNHGARVVQGQWLMQAASDIFLGWLRAAGLDGVQRDFYVRQLWDWKLSADIDALPPKGLEIYGRMCGWTLARAHARSGDSVAIGAYLGSGDVFDRAIADFSELYADQAEADHRALAAAVKAGRLAAQKVSA
jgi:uncharacterized protein (DUF2252 family)